MSTGPVTRRTIWVAAAAVLVLGPLALLIPAALGIRSVMRTGPVTRRTIWVAAAAVLVVLGAWTLLISAALGISVGPWRPTEVLVGALLFGWPHALAAATAVIAIARAASGADGPARLLALVSRWPVFSDGL
jgi:hypothetical protein